MQKSLASGEDALGPFVRHAQMGLWFAGHAPSIEHRVPLLNSAQCKWQA